MLTVRRLYILAAAFIGLLLFMHASSELLRLAILTFAPDAEFSLGSDWWREQLSLNLALIAVGTPLWLGHWIWAQRLARNSAEEASPLRALFFLGVLGVTLIETAEGAGEVLFVPLARLAGNPFETANLLDHLAEVVIYGLFWTYHIRQRPPAQLQTGAAATITRWYWYAASFGSLGIVVTSLIPLLTTIIQRFIGAESADVSWWELPVVNSVAWIVVGSIGWSFHWAMIQRQTATADSPELRSALRKVYLYLSVGIAAAGALLAIGRILYLILLNILSAVDDQLAFRDNLAWIIPVAVVAATGWFYHRYHLQQDAALVSELPRQASIRRVYSYLLTAIGISLLAFGAFGVLRLIVGILTGQADTLDLPEKFLQQQLSLYVTLLLVGLAAWVWYWRQIQHDLGADESGEERGSLVRRIYLSLVSSASVIAVVIAVGTLLYQGLRSVLGIGSGNDFIDALNINVSLALIAITLLAYHVRFLRLEHRAPREEREPTVTESQAPSAAGVSASEPEVHSVVVTLTGGNLKAVQAQIAQSSLPEGTELALLETSLTPDEVRRRLQAPQDNEE